MKRCQAISPTSALRCQLNRKHTQDPNKLHRKGSIVWGHAGAPGHSRDQLAQNAQAANAAPYSWKPTADEVRALEFAEERFGAGVAALDPGQQLIDWWMGRAAHEVEQTVPKAVEYSSTDLADIGHQLARTAGRTIDDEEAAELGIFFYLQGKLSRWAGAVAQGRRPSDDTIFDIGVYCRMAQRIRHSGGWPGINKEEQE